MLIGSITVMKSRILLFLLLTLSFALASCDKGLLPILPVVVYEPGQKAIIAWNGTHELLILSADMYSEAETKVLEILPLPSVPSTVELGSFESFIKAMRIVEAGLAGGGRDIYRKGVPLPGEGVTIVFHEKLGIHDVTIIEASSFESFASWAEDFLSKNGLSMGYDWKSLELKTIVEDYFKRGLNIFVFDIVDVKPLSGSNEPLLYMFRSEFLYFPLKISRLAKGSTNIAIFTVTSELIDEQEATTPGFRIRAVVRTEARKISEIDERIAEMFRSNHLYLTLLIYNGPIEALSYDLAITKIHRSLKWVKVAIPQASALLTGIILSVLVFQRIGGESEPAGASLIASAVSMMKFAVSACLLYKTVATAYINPSLQTTIVLLPILYETSTSIGLLSTVLLWRRRKLGVLLYIIVAGVDLSLLVFIIGTMRVVAWAGLVGLSLTIVLIPNIMVLYASSKILR